MLRIYAMMGLSRKGMLTSLLIGLVGTTAIALDVVSLFYYFTTFFNPELIRFHSVARCTGLLFNIL
jgi:hypothetical protein